MAKLLAGVVNGKRAGAGNGEDRSVDASMPGSVAAREVSGRQDATAGLKPGAHSLDMVTRISNSIIITTVKPIPYTDQCLVSYRY